MESKLNAEKSPRRGVVSAMRLVAKLLLLAWSLALTSCAAYGPPHAGEKISRNVLFASPKGHDLHMDLYVPHTDRPAPVVIWVFGGSWRIGSKGYHVNVRELTRYGIAVAAIEYRLSATAKYPAQLDDCRTAAQWLRQHGSQYGIDPHQIGVSGESAGGHLAALLGTVEGAPRIRAVCALYPPTDLVRLGRLYANPKKPSAVEQLLGGPIEEKLALATEASPVTHVRASVPPFLIIHGGLDTLVPLDQSQDLHRRLLRSHVESRLIVVPGKGHWFLLNESQLAEVARFFRAHFASSKPQIREDH
jgi:acetyl esterase/lipase